MNAKVLAFALAAAIIGLPLPAAQLLAASAPLPAKAVTPPAGATDLSMLLADPFLIDHLSFEAPVSHLALGVERL